MTAPQVGETWYRNADKAPATIAAIAPPYVDYTVLGVGHSVLITQFVKYYSPWIIEDAAFIRKLAADLGVLLDRTTELATTVRKIADLVGVES